MAILKNLLTIVQDACGEMGLQQPATVVGATDLQTQQIFALIKREVRELQQNYDWTALQTEYDLHVGQPITTTGNVTQNSYQITNIPATIKGGDFNTDFNFDFSRPQPGPLVMPGGVTAQLWVANAQFIPVAARVVSVDSPTQVTLSEPATGTQANVSIVFAQDTYPEPQDFDRFINQTWWDRTNRWALMGPDSPQIDQWHRSGIVTIGPRRHFRQIGAVGALGDFNSDFGPDFANGQRKNYRLWPPPGATDTPLDLVYEYITQNSIWSVNGIPQAEFLADTDVYILDPHMLILGAKWRFFDIKGWDYASKQAEYRDYVDRAYANDGGNKTLNMSTSRYGVFISPANVQDGDYPGPIGPNV